MVLTTWQEKRGERYGLIVTLDAGSIAEKLFPRLQGAFLFAYLFRRFGYPNTGWDGEGELVVYRFCTGEEGLFLTVHPNVNGNGKKMYTDTMFSCFVSKEREDEYRRFCQQEKRENWIYSATGYRFRRALEEAIKDLLRPVFVGNRAINCLGLVEKEQLKDLPQPCQHFCPGDYSIPEALFRDETITEAFFLKLFRLGKGDLFTGMNVFLEDNASPF